MVSVFDDVWLVKRLQLGQGLLVVSVKDGQHRLLSHVLSSGSGAGTPLRFAINGSCRSLHVQQEAQQLDFVFCDGAMVFCGHGLCMMASLRCLWVVVVVQEGLECGSHWGASFLMHLRYPTFHCAHRSTFFHSRCW